jgi:multifunctional 2-oxoglutarate metabolism enzyme
VTADAGQFAGFGPNEWLVYEMYQQYQRDPDSVDKAWWDFFSDYSPSEPIGHHSATPNGSTSAEPAATAPAPARSEPAPAAAPSSSATPATPSAPASPATATAPAPTRATAPSTPGGRPLKGAAARTVINMEASLSVPTATSVRAVPAKLLVDNRVVINNHLRRGRGGKVGFTHLIG